MRLEGSDGKTRNQRTERAGERGEIKIVIIIKKSRQMRFWKGSGQGIKPDSELLEGAVRAARSPAASPGGQREEKCPPLPPCEPDTRRFLPKKSPSPPLPPQELRQSGRFTPNLPSSRGAKGSGHRRGNFCCKDSEDKLKVPRFTGNI